MGGMGIMAKKDSDKGLGIMVSDSWFRVRDGDGCAAYASHPQGNIVLHCSIMYTPYYSAMLHTPFKPCHTISD